MSPLRTTVALLLALSLLFAVTARNLQELDLGSDTTSQEDILDETTFIPKIAGEAETQAKAQLVLETCKIEDAAKSGDYSEAAAVYVSSGLKALAESTSPKLDATMGHALLGNEQFEGNAEAREQAVKKLPAGILANAAIDEMAAAQEALEGGNQEGAREAWNNVMAYYVGAQPSCASPYGKAIKRNAEMESDTNVPAQTLAEHNNGRIAINNNDASGLDSAVTQLTELIEVPFFQGAVKYAEVMQEALDGADFDTPANNPESDDAILERGVTSSSGPPRDSMQTWQGEAYAYYLPVAPAVAACDQGANEAILGEISPRRDVSTLENPESVITGALESVYSCLGFTAKTVGTLEQDS